MSRNSPPSGVSTIPKVTTITSTLSSVSTPPGLLRQNGPRVRSTKSTSTSVRIEPKNQALWNSLSSAWNTSRSTRNVTMSKAELMRPKTIM